jgi:hypothetical protein
MSERFDGRLDRRTVGGLGGWGRSGEVVQASDRRSRCLLRRRDAGRCTRRLQHQPWTVSTRIPASRFPAAVSWSSPWFPTAADKEVSGKCASGLPKNIKTLQRIFLVSISTIQKFMGFIIK